MAEVKGWDYLPDYARDRAEILAAVDRVFSSGKLILGPEVERFEAAFAEQVAGTRYGVGVDNATNAAMLVLRALGIGPGDEVVTVPLTAVPTVAAIAMTGATPVFVDVEPTTLLMDPRALAQALTPRTRAVIPVHLYGQMADMDAILAVATPRGIPVIEDCAQAHGATQRGRPAGSFGLASTFSFYPTKPLGAFGDGGLVATSDRALAETVRRLRFYGMERTYYAETHGYNSRLDEVQAAILNERLPRLASDNERRRALARRYRERLAGLPIEIVATGDANVHVHHQFVVRHAQRDEIARRLRDAGIGTGVHYPHAIHLMRGYLHLGYGPGAFPVTERATETVLSLPLYPSLPDDAVDAIAARLAAILGDLAAR